MSARKIITVLGATGAQGGSVADVFLSDTKLHCEWTVRAVTRDPSKPEAQKLRNRGAEVVRADLDDKSSLIRVFTGAAAAFAVTNFWEEMSMDVEIQQGKNIVDAAKETGLPHLIWSSLRSVAELTKGKLSHVYHFESKAEVERYAIQQGVPSTFFLAGFYMQNLIGNLFKPEPPQNNWTLMLPMPENTPIPLFDVENTGNFVKAVVTKRDQLLNKRVLGASRYQTPVEIVNGFTDQFPELSKNAMYKRLSNEDFQKRLVENFGLTPTAALQTSETMMAMSEGGYFGFEPLDESLALLEEQPTAWMQFLARKVNIR
ncbi:related to nitrogen metabolic regulation protein nmr [Cephalotrichum gorgonifer]|uniref:Related to nitrogen metabolic regulation protein nmr n=1 Tax=Cephalotrichum gorgonifer TaxID=2041049 RepID=A0AAE8N566_9PEZI|nr:related to nitrogen metabolic regulation protein nmr [Cephalotrichum gorgonifer]